MANPKITLSVDQSIIDTLVNLTAALNRVADSMSGVASATDAVSKSAKIAKEAMMAESVAAVPNPNAFVVGEQIKNVPAVSPELMEKAAASAPVQVMPSMAPVTMPAPAPAAMPIMNQMLQQASAPSPVAQPVMTAPVVQQPAPMPVSQIQSSEPIQMQLKRAGVSLMDKGIDVNTVLWEFGVQSVDQLNEEQCHAFANRLRQLGAKI